jgi:hypothetical protein
MSRFGKYAVIEGIQYPLEREPSLWWGIRAPTAADELTMARYIAANRFEKNRFDDIVEIDMSNMEIAIQEIAILFDGTNIPWDPKEPVEKGGKPLVRREDGIDAIKTVISIMPADLVTELWIALRRASPSWGPSGPNQPAGNSTS